MPKSGGSLWFGLFLVVAGLGMYYLIFMRQSPEQPAVCPQGDDHTAVATPGVIPAAMTFSAATQAHSRPSLNPNGRTLNPLPAFQGGGALLGQAEPIGPPPMEVVWTWKADENERAGIDCSPVVANGLVYVADAKGTLRALDLNSGTVRWTCKLGDGFGATPMVLDGKVLVGDLSGIFYAISADAGQKLWTYDSGTTIHSSANAVGANIVFANDGGDIVCLRAADGKVVWKAEGGDRINSALSVGHGLAYVGGCDSQLRGLDENTGKEQFAFPAEAVIPGSPVLVGDRIVFGLDQGRVLCIGAADHKTIWTYEGITNELMVYATPAIADGIVVVGARDRQVHGIDLATGKGLWKFMTRGEVDAPALISSGRVYVGSKDKNLYVLDLKTGKPLWQFNAARPIESAAAISEGKLVFADSGGTVFCLKAGK
jgi:outer membrane protein assembly factor BamB